MNVLLMNCSPVKNGGVAVFLFYINAVMKGGQK